MFTLELPNLYNLMNKTNKFTTDMGLAVKTKKPKEEKPKK